MGLSLASGHSPVNLPVPEFSFGLSALHTAVGSAAAVGFMVAVVLSFLSVILFSED